MARSGEIGGPPPLINSGVGGMAQPLNKSLPEGWTIKLGLIEELEVGPQTSFVNLGNPKLLWPSQTSLVNLGNPKLIWGPQTNF